ncbi:hypothetical protein G6F31_018965 [Rhizopus arrhizus]|nr:hypothetical protein G6F31_018965 [Rhizopus arrhizus]
MLGWTRSVTSKATLPLRCTSTRWPSSGTLSSDNPWRAISSRAAESRRTGFSGWFSVRPRRGSVLIWLSISSVMVDLPSPVTQASSPAAAATMRLPTTSKRCSLPSTKRSTITPLPSSTATR